MKAGDKLRLLAKFRKEYYHGGTAPDDDAILLQVETLKAAAKILDGYPHVAAGMLPSWRWDEWQEATGMDMSLDE